MDKPVGMIADELDQKMMAAQALLGNNMQILVPATGLATHSGPVTGMAIAQTHHLDTQLSELCKALKAVAGSVRKLEDKVKQLEAANMTAGRPPIPVGFRK